MLEHISIDDLITRIEEMHEQLTKYRPAFSVDSLEELTDTRMNQAVIQVGPSQDEADPKTTRGVVEHLEPLAAQNLTTTSISAQSRAR